MRQAAPALVTIAALAALLAASGARAWAPAADGSMAGGRADEAGAAAPLPLPPPPPRAIGASVGYVCDGGRRFSVGFDEYSNQMTVMAGGEIAGLKPTPSASGARFTAPGRQFWSQGRRAVLTGFAGGPYDSCLEG